MTNEEFQKITGWAPQGLPPQPATKTTPRKIHQTAPQTEAVEKEGPRAYPQKSFNKGQPKQAGGGFSTFKGATIPLVVRQSEKDGTFRLAGKMTFTIQMEQDVYDHVVSTGQGLDGRNAEGQWVDGVKVGELTVWPPFSGRRKE